MERFAQLAEGVGEFEQISLRLAINLMDYDEIKKIREKNPVLFKQYWKLFGLFHQLS